MNLLSNLSYKPFDGFYIRVDRIKYGWMDIVIGNNAKYLDYSASCLSDPLNDLLTGAVYLVKPEEVDITYRVNYFGDYFYITHDLEPVLITWLFKKTGNELTLIIWEDMPSNFEEITGGNFESTSHEIEMLKGTPDLGKKLAFAIKVPINLYLKSLIQTFQTLNSLKRADDDISDWGFSYSKRNLKILEERLSNNDTPLN